MMLTKINNKSSQQLTVNKSALATANINKSALAIANVNKSTLATFWALMVNFVNRQLKFR
jgi:hypothetical protein